jgi:hypothetical protein
MVSFPGKKSVAKANSPLGAKLPEPPAALQMPSVALVAATVESYLSALRLDVSISQL